MMPVTNVMDEIFLEREYLWKLPEELLTEEIEKSGVVDAEEVETIDEAEVEMTVEAVMVDETDQFGLTNMDLLPVPIFVLLWKIFLAVSAGRASKYLDEPFGSIERVVTIRCWAIKNHSQAKQHQYR